MRPEPTCPRCGSVLRAPGLWSSAWQCAQHGDVEPYTVIERPGTDGLDHAIALARVPVWMPHPLPSGWVISGFAYAGDDRHGAHAVVTCLTGPSPLGGAAELMLVSEDPGLGLGARHAGLPGPDPGDGFDHGPPDAKLAAAGHPTALWSLPTAQDCAVFVGEAKALWLWALVWPGAAGLLLYEALDLADLRDGYVEAELAFGSVSPRLGAVPAVP